MPGTKEQEYREEAERLAGLPREDQKAVIKLYRDLATDPLATKACRTAAASKAAALERHLRQGKKKS